jgi:GT2 family glycosyltransferase
MDFELVIFYLDDDEALKLELETYQDKDERIKLVPLPAATDETRDLGDVIEYLQGEYLFFIRCGDRVHRQLFQRVSDAVAKRYSGRPADILYFDEDQIDDQGDRVNPWFKPGTYSPEMLLSVNYLSRAAYSRKLFYDWVRKIPIPLRSKDEWALAFHAVEQARGEIIHLPHVLYHSRIPVDSIVHDDPGENLAIIEGHMRRNGMNEVTVTYSDAEGYKTTWDIDDRNKVSIIIPTKNNYQIIKRCVDSILQFTDYRNYEIVLVDSGSSDPRVKRFYSKLLNKDNVVITYMDEEFNYSRANNLGAMKASGELLLFLNNDMEVLVRGWLSEMIQWVKRSGVGAVSAKLLFPDGTIQAFGTVIGMLGLGHHVFRGMPENSDSIFGSTMWYRNMMAITGACMLIRREVFQGVGQFNTDYKIVFSDVDISLKIIEAGYRILCTPYARLTHHEGKTRFRYTPVEDIKMAIDRLGGFIQEGDRYYNNNLSRQSTIPALRARDEEDTVILISRVIQRMLSVKDKES